MKQKYLKILKTIKAGKKFITPLALCLLLLVTVAFTGKRHKERVCNSIDIQITDAEHYKFVNEADILDFIKSSLELNPLNKSVSELSLDKIEKRLLKNSFIRSADVFVDMKGKMNIVLEQRFPIIRVVNRTGTSYYLDEECKRMPLSTEYAAYVPLAVASHIEKEKISDSLLKITDTALWNMAKYFATDPFASALTGQIIIDDKNEFSIIPRLGDFTIYLGDSEDLENKFKRLKSFYKTVLPHAGWKKYKLINLKYKNQIIANT